MSRLTTLKSRLQTGTARLPTLTERPNVVERKRGYAGVLDRRRIRERDCDLCQNCGRLGRDVDHDVPLWVGVSAGGTDEENNKRVLCAECHQAKTELEASQRAAGLYDRSAILDLMRELKQRRKF